MTTTLSKDARALGHILAHHGVTLVFDVGANEGQYARKLRSLDYHGRIVSFEPLSAAHAVLSQATAADPAWTLAPPLALGETPAQNLLYVSPESDMSSLLPMRAPMADLLSGARPDATELVRVDRLDAVFDTYARPDDVVFLKVDTQGFDLRVLAGAAGVLPRILGLQLELAIEPVYEKEPDWLTAVKYVQTWGYDPVYFMPGYFNKRTARLLSMDGLFIRTTALDRRGAEPNPAG